MMYTVQENDGQVTLTATVQGDSVIENAVLIFTSDNTSAQGMTNSWLLNEPH